MQCAHKLMTSLPQFRCRHANQRLTSCWGYLTICSCLFCPYHSSVSLTTLKQLPVKQATGIDFVPVSDQNVKNNISFHFVVAGIR